MKKEPKNEAQRNLNDCWGSNVSKKKKNSKEGDETKESETEKSGSEEESEEESEREIVNLEQNQKEETEDAFQPKSNLLRTPDAKVNNSENGGIQSTKEIQEKIQSEVIKDLEKVTYSWNEATEELKKEDKEKWERRITEMEIMFKKKLREEEEKWEDKMTEIEVLIRKGLTEEEEKWERRMADIEKMIRGELTEWRTNRDRSCTCEKTENRSREKDLELEVENLREEIEYNKKQISKLEYLLKTKEDWITKTLH